MGSKKPLAVLIGISMIILFSGLYARKQTSNEDIGEVVYIGCTPGDQYIKSVFDIPADNKVDFMRWNLTLKNQKTFLLHLEYGVSRPNTTGFIDGGKLLTLEGEFSVSHTIINDVKRTIYWLKSNNGFSSFEMVKINDNLFHLLTPGNKLMVGNGGWSYTLNRKVPVPSNQLLLLNPSYELLLDTARQTIFEGRTPCLEIARDANLEVTNDCFKLKWKLILSRDTQTLEPTTFQLLTTNQRNRDIKGNWTIIKGTASNPDAVIYQLDPDNPGKSISFFAADENIIFFIDKENRLFTGNQDFSYTLNRVLN
jgi:hypothetical protein